MEQFIKFIIGVGFLIFGILLGLLLVWFFYIVLPRYLADKTIKALFPSLRAEARLFRFQGNFVVFLVVLLGVGAMGTISLEFLGVNHPTLPIPPRIGALLPVGLYRVLPYFSPLILVFAFIAQFITVFFCAWRLQRRRKC